ncbi:glycoside hydrolase family 127 protein [Flavihumibacter petaseus]|uniref:Uncharacterized protein n=1 Tax=Flavihumibacter petaseus NBRC 106054 TaxID=1220578 RepID=A0A0E9MV22_9BACT|nr:glycoside hydrolase family 127 protein [Flavihumibacter petaseus]GAO41409.1 hypothetical protein FPE01S_01_04210 [Flavihumibacter petaseus NBRC 106054]
MSSLAQAAAQEKMQPFPLQQVRLLEGPFKEAQLTDMNYMLRLDPDRLLAPYLKEAGLAAKMDNYPNWENTGLDGHIGGHYLSALSLMYAATGDARMNERLDYMLAELKRCQDKIGTGYLGGMPGGIQLWQDIAAGKITSDTFALNGKWVPLYNLHKTLAGLRDAYTIAGKEQGKVILIKLVDFVATIAGKLSDDQIQTMLVSEHGGLNEVFADVSVITGDQKYLQLAKRFSHKILLDQLVQGQDKMNGLHANMQIPKAVGYKRIATLSNDASYAKAAQFFWETVTQHRSVVIGGNSVDEHFNPTNDYRTMMNSIAGPETCNSYNMLKLTGQLFETSGSPSYIDFYERVLYNHILSSQHPETGGFVYYTPMRPRHYRTYSNADDCMWCCVGSGMENHGKYGELIYAHQGSDLYVNLFMASRLEWKEKGMVVRQETNFPDVAAAKLTVESAGKGVGEIHIRYPAWVAEGKLEVAVNGKKIPAPGNPGSYITLNRAWKKGDVITVNLPMTVHSETLPDQSAYVAFVQGPIVLAALTDTTRLDNRIGTGSDQFGGYRAKGKVYGEDEVPVVVKKGEHPEQYLVPVAGKPQTYSATAILSPESFRNLQLIPFYKLHDARYMIYWPVKEK